MLTPTRTVTERQERGFTLVELLMAMLVSTVIMGAMYCAFHAQQRTLNAQEQVADMELNARAALSVLAEDFRMAGFDPGGVTINKKIRAAEPGRFEFEQGYLIEKAGRKEWAARTIIYRLPGTIGGKPCDADGNGVVDSGWTDWSEERPYLARVVNGVTQAVARGVEAVEFVYLMGDDMTPTLRPANDKLDDIRAVTVTLLMRGVAEDRTISPRSPESLRPGSMHIHGLRGSENPGWKNISGAQLRRRVHYTTVQLRNTNLIKP